VLATLQQLERELVELRYTQRLDAQERVREALRRLGEAGAPDAVFAGIPAELGAAAGLERVLVSRVRPDRIVPLAATDRDPRSLAALGRERPTVEVAVAVERGVLLIDDPRDSPLAAALELRAFVLAAVVLRGETVALIHAGAPSEGRPLSELHRELVALFSSGLPAVLERALLQGLLRRNRAAVAGLARFLEGEQPPPAEPAGLTAAEPLTAREREVLELLAAGAANREIAARLAIRESTVKYHVKNILRKLRAGSRAEAVARHGGAPG
jgi:DNA-binding NarL/FixJ family response regulator